VRVRNRVRDKVRVRDRVSIRVRGCLCRMVYTSVALALIATCEHVGPCCVLVRVRLRVRVRTSEKVTTSDGSLPAAYLTGGTCPTAGRDDPFVKGSLPTSSNKLLCLGGWDRS
jgi:hypothetical protein